MSENVIWIAQHVLESLRDEADRRFPRETGGVLLGYRAADTGELVVTGAIGPGPRAIHDEGRFRPDQRYHVAEIARHYVKSGRTLSYLGDWHTHPGGDGRLSTRDLTCLRTIANCREARVRRPIMLVLAGGPEWRPFGWLYVGGWRCLRRQSIAQPLAVSLFDSD